MVPISLVIETKLNSQSNGLCSYNKMLFLHVKFNGFWKDRMIMQTRDNSEWKSQFYTICTYSATFLKSNWHSFLKEDQKGVCDMVSHDCAYHTVSIIHWKEESVDLSYTKEFTRKRIRNSKKWLIFYFILRF